MAIYSATYLTTGAGSAQCAALEITAPSRQARLLEMSIMGGAVSNQPNMWGLGRPSKSGTASAPTTVQADHAGEPAGTVTLAIAWTSNNTTPTIPIQDFRRLAITTQAAANFGCGIIFAFPRGLIIPVGGSLVLWHIQPSNGSVATGWVVVDE